MLITIDDIEKYSTGTYPDTEIRWAAGKLDGNVLKNFPQLDILDCSYNDLESLDGIESCPWIGKLFCYQNKLTSLKGVESCTQLRTLDCSHNELDSLEGTESCKKLRVIYCHDNKITNLKPVVHLQKLNTLASWNNPLDSPTIQEQRLLHKLKRLNSNGSVYLDKHNVLNGSIQNSVHRAVKNLLKDPAPSHVNADQLDVSDKVKELLKEYCKDETFHSYLLITYSELLDYVVPRLTTREMLNVFEQEILDAEDTCFEGRISRTINALAGFYDDIEIRISDVDRLSSIVHHIYMTESPANRQAKIRHVLEELGYDELTIDVWSEDLVN